MFHYYAFRKSQLKLEKYFYQITLKYKVLLIIFVEQSVTGRLIIRVQNKMNLKG